MNLTSLLIRPKQKQGDEEPRIVQLGLRPTIQSRRLTIHDATPSRPSLLTKQTSFKSSSALPTLNTLAATSTSTPSASDTTGSRRSSSVGGPSTIRPLSMAAKDISATDLLKQAIANR
jgi:hypothetical protein